MTTPPALPSLAGLAWSRHKKPGFSTRVAPHVSGREVRVSLMSYPLYEFEAVYNGLASSSTAAFANLGASSLQSLMGFFLQLLGQAGVFLYTDPDDNSVAGQSIGSGDGTTQSFVMGRTLGGFNEPVSWVAGITNVYLNGVAQSSASYVFTAPNSLGFYIAPAAGVAITADFTYAFQCRFLEDQMDFEEFMASLWKLGSMKFRSIKANTVAAPAPVKYAVFLTSGTSWTVPSNAATALSIEAIGGGGGGAGGDDAHGLGQPGSGAAYSKITNVSLTPGATVYYAIGAGGAGGSATGPTSGATGGDTWMNVTGVNAVPTNTAQGVLAKAGSGGAALTGTSLAGGAAVSCIGTTVYAGGSTGTVSIGSWSGGDGGGAAGPTGAGAQGGNAVGGASKGGGGGGGSDGGTAGGNASASQGGSGGNNSAGAGSGAGSTGTGNGAAGTNSTGHGGGGGGGGVIDAGGAGGAGANWTQTSPSVTAGAGGGGGGGDGGAGGGSTAAIAGNGGLYGGGGGSGGDHGAGGSGAQGIIVITYAT